MRFGAANMCNSTDCRGPIARVVRGRTTRGLLRLHRIAVCSAAQGPAAALHARQGRLQGDQQQKVVRVGAQHLRRPEQGPNPQESDAPECAQRAVSIVSQYS